MRTLSGVFLSISILAAFSMIAQAQETNQVARLDPALDDIVPAAVKIEKVAGKFGHLEGLVWVRKGKYLLFADNIRNVIYKWSPNGKVSVFLERADQGFTSDGVSRLGGPNGMTLDPQGRVLFGTRIDHAIMRLEADGKRTVVASQYEGKSLKAINDLVYKSDGSLYFTDTTWGIRERREKGLPDVKWDLPAPELFLLKGGKLQLLTPKMNSAAGLALSPDEKYIYLNDNNKKMMRYAVQPDGTVANGELFIDRSADKAPGASDGLKVDRKGNVYCPGPAGVWIISPTGKHLGTLLVPDSAAHLAFGDADGKTLYVTSDSDLYRIRLKIPGVRP
jgi:gluconolactonase